MASQRLRRGRDSRGADESSPEPNALLRSFHRAIRASSAALPGAMTTGACRTRGHRLGIRLSPTKVLPLKDETQPCLQERAGNAQAQIQETPQQARREARRGTF